MADGQSNIEKPVNPPHWKEIPAIDPKTGEALDFEGRVAKTWGIKRAVPPRPLNKEAVERGQKAGEQVVQQAAHTEDAASGLTESENQPPVESPLQKRLREMREHLHNGDKKSSITNK